MKPGTYARFETSMGNFTVELFDQQAPNTVANFIKLTKTNFYYGVIFHRFIDRFIIQGGDPTGTGRGCPGYTFAALNHKAVDDAMEDDAVVKILFRQLDEIRHRP